MIDSTTAAASFDPSAAAIVRDLRARFPDTPFLALGQTALWDEPTKAAFRSVLDALWPEARLIAAVHDSDYFAKLPGHPAMATDAKYALVVHDDAQTRGLWSAAGEMSQLFGSEDVPTQARLEGAGVSLPTALRGVPDPAAFLSELTGAWGWTGIIQTEADRKIAADVPLKDILPTLLRQIEDTTSSSIACLHGNVAVGARAVAGTIRGWVETFAQARPDASLSDLYRDLFPRFYELLLGAPPANLSTSSTLRLLRFNRETAGLPRFAFVDLFLRPETRGAAIDAYNTAVGGTDTYTLDRFGEGALPFDLVIPGKGRGTLSLRGNNTVRVETAPPITLCTDCRIESATQLADLVERELGPHAALVGKAVSLIPQLAAEFVLVFHEGASGYTDRTRQLTARLAAQNVALPALRPILRIRYRTWDALAAAAGNEPVACDIDAAAAPPTDETPAFRLPEHLAQAFGRPLIALADFSSCWHYAVHQETQRLADLRALRAPRALLAYLARLSPDKWRAPGEEYAAAHERLLAVWNRAQAIQGRVYTLYDQVRQLKREAAALEGAKGDDFRARVRPLVERLARAPDNAVALRAEIDAIGAERAARFDREIEERRTQVRFALGVVRDLKEKRLALERGDEATSARDALRRLEANTERARARLAKNALQTIHGLPHTDFRPSSWWFPLVDPSGAWFRRLSETAVFSLEELRAER